jgi:hypothetical protein
VHNTIAALGTKTSSLPRNHAGYAWHSDQRKQRDHRRQHTRHDKDDTIDRIWGSVMTRPHRDGTPQGDASSWREETACWHKRCWSIAINRPRHATRFSWTGLPWPMAPSAGRERRSTNGYCSHARSSVGMAASGLHAPMPSPSKHAQAWLQSSRQRRHMPLHGVVDRGASAGEDSAILDVPVRDDAWWHGLSHHGLTTITAWHVTPQSEGELVRPPCRRQEAAWAWKRSVARG